jgi:hypothetical protein
MFLLNNLPQFIMLVLVFLSLGMSSERSGKERTGTNNFWVDLIAMVISQSILYWGGFYDKLLR